MSQAKIPVPRAALIAGLALLLPAAPVAAQNGGDAGELAPGEVVRIDGDVVGTLMAIDDARLTILTEGKPRCWPGISHGEAPRCDPAPSVRQVVDWRTSTVERHDGERSYARRTIVGFLVGVAVGAPAGWLTGPALGYGGIDACVQETTNFCADPIPRAEADAQQRSQDQRRGALFFGVIGGTAGAIIARRLADEWVEVRPPASLRSDDPWSVAVRLPLDRR